MQLHMDFPRFYEHLQTRIRIFPGDLTSPQFGLNRDDYDRLIHTTDSVIHCAASLNRKSEKSCLNVNLRGTLEVLQLARRSHYYHGLRRFSNVSTVAVAGKRRTRWSPKIVPSTGIVRTTIPTRAPRSSASTWFANCCPTCPSPSSVPASCWATAAFRKPRSSTWCEAFVFLASLKALPFRPNDKIDIVNVDFVADAIASLHQKAEPKYDTYHLSSGRDSQTFREVTTALAAAQQKRGPVFLPVFEKPFSSVVNSLANRSGSLAHGAALMKVFMPYLVWNTVFDNTRVTSELGRKPVPFSQYSLGLLKFSRESNFTYHYKPWPAASAGGSAA